MRLAVCVLIVASGAASAQLQNADIESNTSGLFGSIDFWGPSGGWADHAGFARPNNGSLGAAFGFYSVNNGESVGQVLDAVFAPNKGYDFWSWAQGGGDDDGLIPYEIGYQDNAGGFVSLASAEYSAGQTWAEMPGVSYSTGAAGDEIGRPIWVRLGETNSAGATNDVWFDNFNFVPAPGAISVLALGGLVAARRR